MKRVALMAFCAIGFVPASAVACDRCGHSSYSRYHDAYWRGYRDGEREMRSRYRYRDDDDDYPYRCEPRRCAPEVATPVVVVPAPTITVIAPPRSRVTIYYYR